MRTQTGRKEQKAPSLAGDFWGGLAAMLVALPSSIAFGVLVYSSLGEEYIGQGALAGILGAAALGLVTPFIGKTGGLISAPCAPAAAVLSAFVTGLLAGDVDGIKPESILALMALALLLSAGFQVLYGAIGGGRLIKFVPYPVVSGYLSGVGVLIALGQLPKLFGLPKGTPLFQGVISPGLWRWQGLVTGIVTMAVMVTIPRITRKVPAAIYALLGGMFTYFFLGFLFPELRELTDNPLIIGPIHTSGSFLETFAGGRTSFLLAFDLNSLRLILIPAITLSVLLSIDTLKTCVVLDALTRRRHNSDRELMGQGVGNLASFLVGGIPGAGTMGPTLVNVTSGGRTPRSGVIEGVFVVMTLLLLSHLVAWVPIGALAGILLVIALRMFDWRSMLRLLRYPAGRLDFAVIAGVIFVAVTVDLIAASVVGVALAILLFIRDQVRGSVIRRKRGLDQVSSKTRRVDSERKILEQYGGQGVFCELQGNLFFGTTDQLFTHLENDLRTKRFILFDMRRVQSMDYTAAHLFEQMQVQLNERGGRLLFTGMPSALHDQRDFERYLAQLGVVSEGGVMVSKTLDSALEWMEERILESSGAWEKSDEQLLDLKEFDLFRGFEERTLGELRACMRELSVGQGQKIFSQGDQGDEIFLIRRGSARILLPLKGGKQHHLATIGRGDFFGELSFLDRRIRSADVEAKVATDLYVLSRCRFDERSYSDPVFGVQVFARLALSIAERLRHADTELQTLEER
ncbi:MAG: SLC26A/SulP transporter family protein [Deltaproteobacteria bacterium]|nr:SLC26A/SulP transporter family protein [Deltaproteobacteria bacterium]